MQKTEIVSREKINKIMELAFQIGEVKIFESYSQMGENIIQIKNYEHYKDYFQKQISTRKNSLDFGLYYEETDGLFEIEK